MTNSRRMAVLVGVAALVAAMHGTASASSGLSPTAGSPFTSITEFISQIPNNGTFGPIGLLNDGSHFFVSDYSNFTMYRFPLGGGSAAAPDVANANGINAGLAVAHGVYYGAAQPSPTPLSAGLYTFDPNTLALGSQVATFPGALFVRQVVVDPQNAYALFVSTNVGIFVVDTSVSPASVRTFARGDYDGMQFTADGSRLFGAAAAGSNVFGFDRSGSLMFDVGGLCCGTDGIAVARPNTILSSGVDVSNNVFVNMNNGTILRIDVNHGNLVTTVASGGTRGDFIAVGPDGTLYVTQTDDVLRLTPPIFQVPGSTPPTITITTPSGGNYTLNQSAIANYSCADGGAGVATCGGTVPSGSPLPTSSVGTQTFTVTGVDKTGNASTATTTYTVSFGVCPLYDQDAAGPAGSVRPIKLALCDANGVDVSGSAITVHATGVTMVSTQTSNTLDDAGNANPDNDFRFDPTLGTSGGYILNLSTKGFTSGTFQLSFVCTGDPITHSVQFKLK